ncbi:hypothetical protein MNBD_ALPHA03-1462 [hydrothermal vent metagenome]|uniref:Uncharacterized protein n=1 Tax=hydrothermal vent metagenome TaxID=652676 RepID=A0A3B1B7H7_9ZZZZ
MTKYDIEIGENYSPSTCHCCGKSGYTAHGFVYKNNDAYAVYYAAWSEMHVDKKVTLALAMGDWDEDKTSDDRTCFGIDVYEGDEEILFRVIDPEESPWLNTDLLGKMISRDEGVKHQLKSEAFSIAEEVIRNHGAIKSYLNA